MNRFSRTEKYNRLMLNALISLIMSLVVNFYYIAFLLQTSGENMTRRPPEVTGPNSYLLLQLVYYFIFMFLLLNTTTRAIKPKYSKAWQYANIVVYCIILILIFNIFMPVIRRNGDIVISFMQRKMVSPMQAIKSSCLVIVAFLYGKIYDLLMQKQQINLENERLKSENLQSRYDVLVGQINPHFLFNSLNSLSMLIREGEQSKAQAYVDELSDTFRYILQSGQSNLTTLKDELAFVNAYKYLLEIRYANKLFFEINIPESSYDYKLPSLSLQPLLENAVKHNTITSSQPLKVSISLNDDKVLISNPIYPKISPEISNGIGLENLANRYKLLVGIDIEVINDNQTFTVVLPLIKESTLLCE